MTVPIPILMYHRIGRPDPESKVRGMFTSPSMFARQLRFLARRGFTPCDFEDLRRARLGEGTLPMRPVLLTFDDGHLDNYTTGLPILRAHGAKATVFVVVGDVGGSGLVWPGAAETQPAELFDWEQARELQEQGVRIESHGWEHRRMTEIEPPLLADQLQRCKHVLERELGRAPIALAYPFGDFSAECESVVRCAGFEYACTTQRRAANLDLDRPLALPRMRVRGYRWIHEFRFRWALERARR